MTAITVSLKEILDAGACRGGFLRALCSRGKITAEQRDEIIKDGGVGDANELTEEILNLADAERFPAASVVTAEYISDAIWALRIRPKHNNLWIKYAVWCAQQVRHLMTDERSLNALDIAWRYSDGKATNEELNAAACACADACAARAATYAADATDAATYAAACAARAATYAADATACADACAARAATYAADATDAATYAAACAARAATYAADATACADACACADATARAAAREIQTGKLIDILTAGEWVE